MVGKVTVAMLERNLMRLYEQFHSPYAAAARMSSSKQILNDETQQKLIDIATNSLRLQVVTAIAITALLAFQVLRK